MGYPASKKFMGRDSHCSFSTRFYEGDNFCDFWITAYQISLKKKVYSKTKEFALIGSKLFPVREDSLSEGRYNNVDTVAFPEIVSITREIVEMNKMYWVINLGYSSFSCFSRKHMMWYSLEARQLSTHNIHRENFPRIISKYSSEKCPLIPQKKFKGPFLLQESAEYI